MPTAAPATAESVKTDLLEHFTDGRDGNPTQGKTDTLNMAVLQNHLKKLPVAEQLQVLADIAAEVMKIGVGAHYTRRDDSTKFGWMFSTRQQLFSGTQQRHIGLLKKYILQLANGKEWHTSSDTGDYCFPVRTTDFFSAYNAAAESGVKDRLLRFMNCDRTHYQRFVRVNPETREGKTRSAAEFDRLYNEYTNPPRSSIGNGVI